jgi:transporter family-2 protein
MSAPGSFWSAAFVMFLTGIGIPILAALNGGLGKAIANPVAACAIVFAVGLAASCLLLVFSGVPAAARFSGIPLPNYLGALFMLAYILAVTYFGPRIGLGNAIFFVLLGQLVAAIVIDHFGWMGAIRSTVTPQRLGGLGLMALGVYFAKRSV